MTNTMNTQDHTPEIRSIRKTGPGAWIVTFVDGLRYSMAGGFRDEADVRESAIDGRQKARTSTRIGTPYTVATGDGGYARTVEGKGFATRDEADIAAQRLTDDTGTEHYSVFGEVEGYYEP